MKLKSLLVASAAISALATASTAQSGTYVSLFGGVASLESDGVEMGQGPFTILGYTGVGSVSVDTVSGFVPQDIKFFPLNHQPSRIVSTTDSRNYYTIMAVTDLTRNQYSATVHRTITHEFVEENMDVGYVVGAALGYEFRFGLRTELELSYRYNDIGGIRHLKGGPNYYIYDHRTNSYQGSAKFYSNVKTTSGGLVNWNEKQTGTDTNTTFIRTFTFTSTQSTADVDVRTEGDVTAFALMANLWYDFPIRNTNVTPFFGAGVGVAALDVSYAGEVLFTGQNTGAGSIVTFVSDTDDTVLAWQVGGGLGFDLGQGISLTAQYRYFATEDLTLPNGSTLGVESHFVALGVNFPLGRFQGE